MNAALTHPESIDIDSATYDSLQYQERATNLAIDFWHAFDSNEIGYSTQFFQASDPKPSPSIPQTSTILSGSAATTSTQLIVEENGTPGLAIRAIHTPGVTTQKPLQQWYGVVTAIGPDQFEANLSDPSGDKHDSVAEVPLDLVEEADASLLKVGAVFYWNVVLVTAGRGKREISSRIRFKRVAKFQDFHRDAIKKYADLFSQI